MIDQEKVMEPGIVQYVFEYHAELRTSIESEAWRHLFGQFKMGTSPNQEREQWFEERFFTKDPAALKLVDLGINGFREHVVQRILNDNSVLFINRCPRCNGVCRTPKAQQCRFCHHAWH